ncbi:MAG: Spy/CpxP family protein refolding chaperone [Rhodospirillales bacterium]|nr:Spy/CpxP family protein refolding chaperone [Rhodospirillales bacterium]
MVNISRKAVGLAAVVGFAVIANVAAAQMGSGPGGGSYGGAMMNNYPAMGPGMMQGWGGNGQEVPGAGPGVSIQNRLDALKTELNITAAEADAWNSYVSAVTAARNNAWSGMQPFWQSAGNGAWNPDQRFAAMDKMVALMKQNYDQEKQAADTLMPHLTPFQQGQAKEILPGKAAWGPRGMWGGMGSGFGMGPGMMGGSRGW